MEENYLKAYNLVIKKYNKDYEYFSMLVVAMYGIITKFPEYYDVIEDIFLNTNIQLNNLSVFDTLYNIGVSDYKNDFSNNEYTIQRGTSQGFCNIFLDLNTNEYFIDSTDAFIIIDTRDNNNDKDYNNNNIILNTFIHEFLHLLKSYYSPYKEEGNSIYLRSGLSITKAKNNSKNKNNEKHYNVIFDESINVLQTSDVLNEIKGLFLFIDDEDIKKYLNSLDYETLDKLYGYDFTTDTISYLWENDHFRELIYKHTIDGNLKVIKDDFDKYTDDDSFNKVSKYLDKIIKLNPYKIVDTYKIILYSTKVLKIISNYNTNYKKDSKEKIYFSN